MLSKKFQLVTDFTPTGDQPEAIDKLTKGVERGQESQVLLGITGSGKTFTMANVIARLGRPTLILAHNKTLAAQLYQEFNAFFPHNAVEYFVSYYDYYQPEAYIARTDTYIEKDMAINDTIDRMRLSATRTLMERRDVIIVASVSCIYGLGEPENYAKMTISLKVGQEIPRDRVLIHLVHLHYKRNDIELTRGNFRVRGDIIEIVPAYEDKLAYRIESFGDEIEKITVIDPLTGKTLKEVDEVTIFPGSHHVTPEELRYKAIETIRDELNERIVFFHKQEKYAEEQRIRQRTRYDMELIKEVGFCKGIENYSRHFSSRAPGDPPHCLIDYFPDDFLLFVDESHQMIPQVRAMYNGDRARKTSLIDFGFRLPSAFDNRPLQFDEFHEKIGQRIYVSATPADYEIGEAEGEVVQQIIRPTGLLDPVIEIKKAEFQVDDSLEEIRKERAKGGKVLVTTLTKKLAEELTSYLKEIGIRAKYLHSDIETLERIQIIKDLREDKFDVLVGINLLREGLDIPEVSLVAILDADKEGFLRSETALIQTCGRAARNSEGRVILYADTMTKSIEACVTVTQKRREVQEAYNKKHKITPKSTKRGRVENLLETFGLEDKKEKEKKPELTTAQIERRIEKLEKQMKEAAKDFRFEDAAALRDELSRYTSLDLFLK